MATQVVMAKRSPTMEEGQLARWLKKEGDKVSMGEPLAEIDTDKATMEMQALSNGVLRKILINEGESAPLGQPIAIIGEPDEDISALLKAAETKAPQTATASSATTSEHPSKPTESMEREAPAAPRESQPTGSPSPDGKLQLISPIAARMAAEAGINLKSMQGSGPGGRIGKRDTGGGITRHAPALSTRPP